MNSEIKIPELRKKKWRLALDEVSKYIFSKNNNMTRMVEIGSFSGESTQVFSKYFKFIICVDAWKNNYDEHDLAATQSQEIMDEAEKIFDQRLLDSEIVLKMKTTSELASELLCNNLFDFIYIDACHTYEAVCKDIDLWINKVKIGGFIGGHDYGNSEHPGVEKAVLEKIGLPDKTFLDTSWVKMIQ